MKRGILTLYRGRMPAVALTLALGLAHAGWAADPDPFGTGLSAYEAGQYEQAARAFRESLAGRPGAGTLVNLGLAEWQSGRNGQAILAWEQAAWLDPFNRAAAGNLRFARAAASVNPPDLTWFEEASTWLPANWWTWLAGGSLWLAVGLMTVPGFLRMRKADWHQAVSAVSLGVFLLSLAPSAGIITRSKLGILLADRAVLRLTPTRAAEVVAELPPGEPVRERRRHGEYVLVHTQMGDGWVELRDIGFIVPRQDAGGTNGQNGGPARI